MTDSHDQPTRSRRRITSWVRVCIVIVILVFIGRYALQRARQTAAGLMIVNAFFGGASLEVESLAFSPGGERLVVGYNYGGLTCLWCVPEGSQLHVVREGNEGEDQGVELAIEAVAFAPDGKQYAVATRRLPYRGPADAVLRIRDASTGRLIRTVDGASAQLLTFNPDWKLFAIGDGICETQEGRQVVEFSLPEKFRTGGYDFSADGSLVAVSGYFNGGHSRPSPIAFIFEVSTGRVVASLNCPVERDHAYCPDIRRCCFSPDGKLLAIGTIGEEFYVWNLENNDVKVVTRDGGRWWAVDFSPNGELLAVSGQGGTVLIWDVKNERILSALKGHLNSVYDLEFSPKGDLLASGGMDGRVRLWGPRGFGMKGWKLVRALKLKPPKE